MLLLLKLLLLAETAFWYGLLIYATLEDSRIQKERELTALWKLYFKENVAHQWTFYDGDGY